MASIHRQKGKRVWFCAYTDEHGKRRFVSTKTQVKSQALIVCQAREKAARRIAAGRFCTDDARRLIGDAVEDMMLRAGAPMPSAACGVWFDRWLASKALDTTDSTASRYRLAIESFRAHLGDKVGKDLSTITAAEVLDYRDKTATRLSPATANTNLRIVRACLGDATKLDLIPRNPASRIPLAKEAAGSRRPFTAKELGDVVRACGDSEWRGAVLVGLYTGQRLRDVTGLTWGQVDLVGRKINFVTKKTGVVLEMFIAKPLHEHLLTLPAPDDPSTPVFPRLSRESNPSDRFYREILTPARLVEARSGNKLSTGAGRRSKRTPSPVTFHSLRHNFVTWLKQTGATEAVAMMIVGHQSKQVSRHYTHLTADDSAEFIDKLPEVK